MKGIALAGFVMTVEEWQELDTVARAQLVAAVMKWDDPMNDVTKPDPVDA
jgi:hypothetical protein